MTSTAYEYYRWQPISRRRRAGRAVATAFCVACLALAGLMLLPGLLGYERYVITSGSMTGSYDRGSIVFDEVVPVSDLQIGDVITYTPPAGAGPSGMITHRIAAIELDGVGRSVFRTKGDANVSSDPWTFTLDARKQARVAFHVPYVGYLLAALSIRQVWMALIGLPALVLAAALIARLRREAQTEAQRLVEVTQVQEGTA